MKTAMIALCALLATVQTVGWVECCCVLICKHHNDPCKDECKDKPQASTASHDCCEKPAPRAPVHEHGKRCSHVEPSSEVVSQAADHVDLTPTLILDLPVIEVLVDRTPRTADAVAESVRGSPPLLHLLYSHLLI
jgi:hypothetical protein